MSVYRFIHKIFIVTFSLVVINFGTVSTGFTANHYVREGADGNNDGSDWENAWTELPKHWDGWNWISDLTRGDTYYVADGSYSHHLFNDNESGSTYIWIIKATESAHGIDGIGSGWDSSYGDGQAIFDETINFITGYYIWDGIVGSGSDSTGYGFKIKHDGNCNKEHYLMGIPAMGFRTKQVDHITVSHTAMPLPGKSCGDGAYGQVAIYSYSDPLKAPNNITISYCYFANGSSNMGFRRWSSSSIENCYFDGNWSSPSQHGQQISPGFNCDDIIVRNNVFKNSTIYCIGNHNTSSDSTTASHRWQVYNNIVIGSNGNITAWAQAESAVFDSFFDNEFHHNTYVDVSFGGRGAIYVGKFNYFDGDRKSFSYNNLYYNCINVAWNSYDGTGGAIIYDYNIFYNCSFLSQGGAAYADSIGTNSINTTGDPFVNNASNWHLTSSIPGSSLSDTFNKDFDGISRTNWDIGAFEYQSGGTPASFSLFQNQPNPFNPLTTITYSLPEDAHVKLVVYNITGQKVTELQNEVVKSGSHSVVWNASEMPSGVYFYTLMTDRFMESKKMLLVK